MHQEIDKIALMVHGIISIASGVVRSLQCNKTGIADLFISAIISGFTGTIFGMLAMYSLGENSYLTLSIAGIGGLSGEKGIRMLIEGLKKRIEIK